MNPSDHRSAEGSEAHRSGSKCLAEDSNKRLEKGRVLNCLGSQIPERLVIELCTYSQEAKISKRMHIYYLPESNRGWL
jgi:hypothetical protein